MAHINVKPLERTRIYETPEQAINHLFIYSVPPSAWDLGGSFGQTIETRRKIIAACKARDYTAFRAFKRRGYWRIELAE